MPSPCPASWTLTLKAWLLMTTLLIDAHAAQADQTALTNPTANAELTVARLFASTEFAAQDPGLVVWCPRTTSSYLTVMAPAGVRPGEDQSGRGIVRIDIVSKAMTVLATAADLTPPGAAKPLVIDELHISDDETKLLLYTNSQRVWRKKTRGDYWAFDLGQRKLKRLGGETKPATMQFAKLSPDGSQVAYVQENNLLVQQLDTLRIIPLTTDGSPTCVNGTGDWVNEEELGIRDGFRWSPDGQTIAFWQFDTSSVPLFHLVDNTAELYPRITSYSYPKVGQANSASVPTKMGRISS